MMDKNKNSMCESEQENESEVIDAHPAQTSKLANQHDLITSSVRRPPSHISTVGVVSSSPEVLANNRNNNLSNDKQPTTITNIRNPQTVNLSKTFDSQTARATSAEVISFTMRKKSLRARPDNPIKYKTLRNAKIRSGKSVRTDIIGYLSKGSVVVINQIKGRSGRIVVEQPDGYYTKVGWVTLYTHDRQQLLEKLDYKRKEGGKIIIRKK